MSDALQDVAPERPFERYVETDPLICNGCFARVQPEERDGITVETEGVIGERVTTDPDAPAPVLDRHERTHDVADRVVGTEPIRDHSARYDWQPYDHCPACGREGLQSPSDPLSIEAASRRALRLSTRLHERGLKHDWRLVVWFVRRAKRQETLAGKDREIAANAVAFALSQSDS